MSPLRPPLLKNAISVPVSEDYKKLKKEMIDSFHPDKQTQVSEEIQESIDRIADTLNDNTLPVKPAHAFDSSVYSAAEDFIRAKPSKKYGQNIITVEYSFLDLASVINLESELLKQAIVKKKSSYTEKGKIIDTAFPRPFLEDIYRMFIQKQKFPVITITTDIEIDDKLYLSPLLIENAVIDLQSRHGSRDLFRTIKNNKDAQTTINNLKKIGRIYAHKNFKTPITPLSLIGYARTAIFNSLAQHFADNNIPGVYTSDWQSLISTLPFEYDKQLYKGFNTLDCTLLSELAAARPLDENERYHCSSIISNDTNFTTNSHRFRPDRQHRSAAGILNGYFINMFLDSENEFVNLSDTPKSQHLNTYTDYLVNTYNGVFIENAVNKDLK